MSTSPGVGKVGGVALLRQACSDHLWVGRSQNTFQFPDLAKVLGQISPQGQTEGKNSCALEDFVES